MAWLRDATIHITLLILVFCSSGAHGQPVPVENPSFEHGDAHPTGWRLLDGNGVWLEEGADGQRAIAVIGNGDDHSRNFWVSAPVSFKPDILYRLRFQARHVEGMGGSLFTGAMFNNRDLPEMTQEWQQFTSYFVTPPVIAAGMSRLRFGQWNINGMAAFDAVELTETVPVYRRRGAITLGEGERIVGDRYLFDAPFVGESANHARPLAGFGCYFNKPRWVFEQDSWVVYCHHIETMKQLDGRLEICIGFYSGGELEIEAGTDGETWLPAGVLKGRDTWRLDLPEPLFPSETLWVRLRARAASGQEADVGGSLQVYGYKYSATLDHAPGDFSGATRFVTTPRSADQVSVAFSDFGDCLPGPNTMDISVKNISDAALSVAPGVVTRTDSGLRSEATAPAVSLAPGVAGDIQIEYEIPYVGTVDVTLDLGAEAAYSAETSLFIAPLFAYNFGARLPDSSETVSMWWASSGWKISRSRPAPRVISPAIRIQAARNESEAAQLALRPAAPLRNLRVIPEPLESATGDILPASALDLFLVGYVSITQPTDHLGAVADWPDPLPPLKQPIDLEADKNQPLWVRVTVPHDSPAGVYAGALTLEADGWRAKAPIEIEVFDFTLPDHKTCQSAFGFDGPMAERYHGVTSEEDRRVLAALYKETLSAHHISPYELGRNLLYPTLEYSWPHVSPWHGGTRVTDGATDGSGALQVIDDNPALTITAQYDSHFDVPDAGVHIAFRYKTENPGAQFMIVLPHYDDTGAWMSGRNAHFTVTGNGAWQDYEYVMDQFPEGAAQFRVQINPALYVEDGSTTGTVLFDHFRISDAGTGAILIEDDFAPYDEEILARIAQPVFTWKSWEEEMERVLDTYHFNSFVLRTPGLGFGAGWAQHDNIPGNLLGYPPGTPLYDAAFNAWYYEAQERLRAKGWLEKAFIYWFDEPVPTQYDFVMEYNLRMKNAAPDLQRMLTEEIVPELTGGPNLWCPISYEYDHHAAEQRRAEGERIWWYICTGPKAPYATLFIDHPATALRVWLWQTWKRNIEGVLIWALNWWTSDAAYPDSLQNPYEDPMSWCHTLGDLVPSGAKHPWGNGDGRFLYPPLAAADGAPDRPVLEPPVGSIRLDMLRDGIEDYEYMVILKTLIDDHRDNIAVDKLAAYEQLLDVPPSITASLTEFTWDPAPIEAHRAAVARAIVQLKNKME